MKSRTSFGLAWKRDLASQSFAITPDAGRLAAGSEGHVFMLDGSGDLLWERELEYHATPLDVYMTPDGSRVAASVEYDSELYMLDGSGHLLWEFNEGRGEVWAVAMTPDGSRVAAVSDQVYMLDGSGELQWRYEAKEGFLGSIAIARDGSQVAAAGWDGHVYMLDGRGDLLWKQRGTHGVGSVVMTPDGSKVVVVPRKYGDMSVFDDRGRLLWKHGRVDGERLADMTPDGNRVGVVNYDSGQLEMLDDRGELLWTYGPPGWVRCFAISPDGSRVAALSYEEGELSVLDSGGEVQWKSGPVGRLPYLPENQMWSLAWTRDGSGLAMGCWGGVLFQYQEAARDHQTVESPSRPPGLWPRALQGGRCCVGLHHGRWEYRTRSGCDQILLCPDHGPTRSRTHHRWVRTNSTFDEDFDNVEEVLQDLDRQTRGIEHYRCRRCSETRTELPPENGN